MDIKQLRVTAVHGILALGLAALTACGAGVETSAPTTSLSTREGTTVPTTAGTSITTSTIESTTSTTQPQAGFTRDIEWGQGFQYRVQITVDGPEPRGTDELDTDSLNPVPCISTAPPGATNIWFTVKVTNLLTDRPASAPTLTFVSNVSDSYDPELRTVVPLEELDVGAALLNHDIAFFPNSGSLRCANATWMPMGEQIEPGDTYEFTGVFGPVAEPVPRGIVFLVSGDQLDEASTATAWRIPVSY